MVLNVLRYTSRKRDASLPSASMCSRGAAIAQRLARRSVSVKMLSYCGTNNATNNTNRWSFSSSSTSSNCHLHSSVQASLQQAQQSQLHVTPKWPVRVINRLPQQPRLLMMMTLHIPPPAHRRGRGPPCRMDTNFRRQNVLARDFTTDRKT